MLMGWPRNRRPFIFFPPSQMGHRWNSKSLEILFIEVILLNPCKMQQRNKICAGVMNRDSGASRPLMFYRRSWVTVTHIKARHHAICHATIQHGNGQKSRTSPTFNNWFYRLFFFFVGCFDAVNGWKWSLGNGDGWWERSERAQCVTGKLKNNPRTGRCSLHGTGCGFVFSYP